jgi:hypothetical protein
MKEMKAKPYLKNTLNDAANQMLDQAGDYADFDDESQADTIGDIGEELTAIARLLDHRICIEAPTAPPTSKAVERIPVWIQILRIAATAVERENYEIASELEWIATKLESFCPVINASHYALPVPVTHGANQPKSGTRNQNRQEHMTTTAPSDSSLRRKAARQGYKVTKIRENSRWYAQYGPFMIADASTNCAVQYGMTPDEVNDWLSSDEVESHATPGAGKAA